MLDELESLRIAQRQLQQRAAELQAAARADEEDAAAIGQMIERRIGRSRHNSQGNAMPPATPTAQGPQVLATQPDRRHGVVEQVGPSYSDYTADLLAEVGNPLTLDEILDGIEQRGCSVYGETRAKQIANLSSRLSKDVRIGTAGVGKRGLMQWPGVVKFTRKAIPTPDTSNAAIAPSALEAPVEDSEEEDVSENDFEAGEVEESPNTEAEDEGDLRQEGGLWGQSLSSLMPA